MAEAVDPADDLQVIDNSLSPEDLSYVAFICLLDDSRRGLLGIYNQLRRREGPDKALELLHYSLKVVSSEHAERLKRHCTNLANEWLLSDAKLQKIPLRACLASINRELDEDDFDRLRDALVTRDLLGARDEYKKKNLR